ncbi:hypothetical protein EJB05_20553, partial [Eragrostis curvula]
MDVVNRGNSRADEEIEKHEPVPGDMESEPAAAREEERVLPWREQLTLRGMVVALVIGFVYSVIVLKLILSGGVVPTLNVSAALLAFLALRGWTLVLERLGITTRPFTRQENTVVETCAVACYGIAYGSQSSVHFPLLLNTSGGFGSTFPALGKKMYELAGNSSAANVPGSYKDPAFGWMAALLVAMCFGGLLSLIPLRKVLVIDYKLTYPSGTATAVLINGFHTKQGDKNAKFFFDFGLTYVGAGMICSHLVNLSALLGAIISWGIMWPLIMANEDKTMALDDIQRNEVFNKDSFPSWAAYTGYILLSVIAAITIPIMFRQVKWYHIIVSYAIAPLLGFTNSYGTGLTDINMAYNYGKIAHFIFAAWAGKDNGVVIGLVAGTVVKQLVVAPADLMHDLKTGHLTLTSPKSLLVAEFIGTTMGCIIAPLTFLIFYNAFDIGNPYGYWKAPFALIYRNMAILGVEGISALPKHCISLCAGFFMYGFLSSIARDILPRKYAKFVPLPMAMAPPFLVGASFSIDMCIGSAVVFVWKKMNKKEATFMLPAVASGLICGDGMWTFPSSLLALSKIKPPISMKFVPGS